jgi:hypothetical protein
MAKFAIVCSYGLVDSQFRTASEMRGLHTYYKDVHYVVRDFGIDNLIFTGGYTNKSFPTETESDTAIRYWKKLRKTLGYGEDLGLSLMKEYYSTTSDENIYFSIEQILRCNGFKKSKSTIHIFCDKPRQIKMYVICYLYLKLNGIKYKIHPCQREDITFKSHWAFQFCAILPMLLKIQFWKNKFRLDSLIRRI